MVHRPLQQFAKPVMHALPLAMQHRPAWHAAPAQPAGSGRGCNVLQQGCSCMQGDGCMQSRSCARGDGCAQSNSAAAQRAGRQPQQHREQGAGQAGSGRNAACPRRYRPLPNKRCSCPPARHAHCEAVTQVFSPRVMHCRQQV